MYIYSFMKSEFLLLEAPFLMMKSRVRTEVSQVIGQPQIIQVMTMTQY